MTARLALSLAVGLLVVVALATWRSTGDDSSESTIGDTTQPSTLASAPGTAPGVPATSSTAAVSTSQSTTTTTTAPSTTAPSTTASTTTAAPPTTVVSTGRFVPASLPERTFGPPPHLRFSVAAEEGSGVDPDDLAMIVDGILADPRSWAGDGVTGLRRVHDGGAFTLAVATPSTVDELCAPLRTNGYFSCARNGWIALNLDRWNRATDEWPSSLAEYRAYVVNHEIGHYLHGPAHPTCPGAGQLAPVMMQQTKGLDGCLPNGWPHPDAG